MLGKIRTRLNNDSAVQLAGLLARVLSAVAGIVISYMMAQRFGAEGSGYYGLIVQTSMLLSLILLGGLDYSVVKEFSATASLKLQASRASVARVILGVFACSVATISILLLLPSSWTMGKIGLGTDYLVYTLIFIIMSSRSLIRVLSAFLRSQNQNMNGQLIESLVVPLLTIVGFFVLRFPSVIDIIWWTAGSAVAAAIAIVMLSLRQTSNEPGQLDIPFTRLMKVGLPMWGLGVALNLADWYSLATVSASAGLEQAGIFRMAVQIGTVLTFGISGMMAVFGAQVSRAHYHGDKQKIALMCRKSAILTVCVITPPVLLLSILAPQLLALIGPGFEAGAATLRILLIGQIAFALLSPAGQTLAMMGFARINLRIVAMTIAIFLGLAPVLMQLLGPEGVALSMVSFLVSRNLLAFTALRKLTGVNSITGRYIAAHNVE